MRKKTHKIKGRPWSPLLKVLVAQACDESFVFCHPWRLSILILQVNPFHASSVTNIPCSLPIIHDVSSWITTSCGVFLFLPWLSLFLSNKLRPEVSCVILTALLSCKACCVLHDWYYGFTLRKQSGENRKIWLTTNYFWTENKKHLKTIRYKNMGRLKLIRKRWNSHRLWQISHTDVI